MGDGHGDGLGDGHGDGHDPGQDEALVDSTPEEPGSAADLHGDTGLTESFGGEPTLVVPDAAPSSHWDRDAQDEDALLEGE
jgi:hypothetical protein